MSCWNTHFIDEECWIYTWARNWNDIRIAENQVTKWWTTTSYKIETKSWPNKNKKIFGCCRFRARLQLQYLTSKFKYQQILRQNSKFNTLDKCQDEQAFSRGLISEGTSAIMVVGAQVFVDAYLLQPPTFQA